MPPHPPSVGIPRSAVLNGTPGYINLLDACNAWQLTAELKAVRAADAVGIVLGW